MLQHLTLKDVGPARLLDIDFAPRLNFVTGNNGLGKSFLLDIAWWALTSTWAGLPASPNRASRTPAIKYRYSAKRRSVLYASRFIWSTQRWHFDGVQRAPGQAIVIYARVDGSFSVWDPARNSWEDAPPGGPERPASYAFGPSEVWDGLPIDAPKKLCRGLIEDWASWQRENGEAFQQLRRVLEHLSPSSDERLIPGGLVRVSLDDVRDHPTLRMPYGQDVALVHASAGMRRIVALAYLLVWTWQEHLRAAALLKSKRAREIVFLIDEVETHLHPQWQRRIVPSLLSVMEALTGQHDLPVQIISATHSPLVLASLEPHFDPDRDAIFELDLNAKREVELTKPPWRRHGDANAWLTSSVFDLAEPRSVEAEQAITRALTVLKQTAPDVNEVVEVDRLLRAALGDVDPFWVRWSAFAEKVRKAG